MQVDQKYQKNTVLVLRVALKVIKKKLAKIQQVFEIKFRVFCMHKKKEVIFLHLSSKNHEKTCIAHEIILTKFLNNC